jgi:hypothetical protein
MISAYGLPRYLDLVGAVRPAVFFANAHEAGLLDVTRPQFAATTTVVKDGARSATVTEPGGVPRAVPVPPAPPARDSTGAGDAFAAGFLAAAIGGAGPVDAARAGHALARSVLFSPGASVSADAAVAPGSLAGGLSGEDGLSRSPTRPRWRVRTGAGGAGRFGAGRLAGRIGGRWGV